jgi:hypothetical protein
MTAFIHKIAACVPADKTTLAGQAVAAITQHEADLQTFSVPLSADGLEPATHYGCQTAATQGFLDLIPDLLIIVPGSHYWLIGEGEGQYGDFDAAIASIGLERISQVDDQGLIE